MSTNGADFLNLLRYTVITLFEWLGLRSGPQISEYQEETLMAITRWDPFREVVALQNRVNSLFREINDGEDPVAAASFVPAVDIYEDTQKVVLKLEVPGIDQKDLDVRVENHTLTVKGERKFEAEEKEQNFHRIERRYGSFFRAFTLPSTVDTENVAASYNAGVLKLELAKKPEAQPKQIKINVQQAA
jgi:HSP20 family protein